MNEKADNVVPFGIAGQTITVTTSFGNVTVKVENLKCPRCDGHYFAHPRLGIRHVCSPVERK